MSLGVSLDEATQSKLFSGVYCMLWTSDSQSTPCFDFDNNQLSTVISNQIRFGHAVTTLLFENQVALAAEVTGAPSLPSLT